MRTTLAVAVLTLTCDIAGAQGLRTTPERIPAKRSSQIADGFGVNSPLPRDPWLPWNRRWWTRMYDGGFNWVRLGQYENSSDKTSWDWVEQNRGVLRVPADVDDYIDWLVDNGVNIQLQLCYGNPMYTGMAGKPPDSILPATGTSHADDGGIYSIYRGPNTPEQIAAFNRYAKYMILHYKGRIKYYELWNEPNAHFWHPQGNAEEYGRLLGAFAKTLRETDPNARIVVAGQGSPNRDFAKRVLDACQCAADVDVWAYHTYVTFGANSPPEQMDAGENSSSDFRKFIRSYPGIRRDLIFWDDEFNCPPSWRNSDESVQNRYLPRGVVYNWANGVRTFVWQLTSATEGNEFDYYGLIHGLAYRPIDFEALPVFSSLQNTNYIFSDTKADAGMRISGPPQGLPAEAPLHAYGFRSRSGKAVVAYWLAAYAEPGKETPPVEADLVIENSGIVHPVLIDITTGRLTPLQWMPGTKDTVRVPYRDSLMAVADESYFDWPVLPEAPSSLNAAIRHGRADLSWDVNDATQGIVIEKRVGTKWEQIAKLTSPARRYTDATYRRGIPAVYRVRAINGSGTSASSNLAGVK